MAYHANLKAVISSIPVHFPDPPREALEKAGTRMADEERLTAIIEANARRKNLIVRAALHRRIVPDDEVASLEGILAGKQTGGARCRPLRGC